MIYDDAAIHGIHAILHRISSATTVCIGTDKIDCCAVHYSCKVRLCFSLLRLLHQLSAELPSSGQCEQNSVQLCMCNALMT